MFACLHGRSLAANGPEGQQELSLIDLAFCFSPLVEHTTADTVVLDIDGSSLLFGSEPIAGKNFSSEALSHTAKVIEQLAAKLNFKVNVAIAVNADASIHAARHHDGLTILDPGQEHLHLGNLPLKALDYSLAGIEPDRAEEIRETLALWGLRTFAELAKLPLAGISQRLGQEGVRLRKLAQGRSERQLVWVKPPFSFEQSIELEHPLAELEPLAFILARLLNQLCASLHAKAMATNELHLRLKLENEPEYERTITLPVPMESPRTFLRLLLLDIESHPPSGSIKAITIAAEAARPRTLQSGLFIPRAPEPEKLEVTLARLAKLVGADYVGSPELLDTHRPDAFQIKRFRLVHDRRKSPGKRKTSTENRQCIMGFRVFRPAWRAEVELMKGRPIKISAHDGNSTYLVRGRVICASGPWRTSGDWWRADVWSRDEWDVAIEDAGSEQSELLCRIYCDLCSEKWFVAGMYD